MTDAPTYTAGERVTVAHEGQQLPGTVTDVRHAPPPEQPAPAPGIYPPAGRWLYVVRLDDGRWALIAGEQSIARQ